MIHMHCRLRVHDFDVWKAAMDSSTDDQARSGLKLVQLWRGTDDPQLVFLILEVHDQEKARQHLNPDDVKRSSETAGVLEFDWDFVERILR